jgi:hypothetical protein
MKIFKIIILFEKGDSGGPLVMRDSTGAFNIAGVVRYSLKNINEYKIN